MIVQTLIPTAADLVPLLAEATHKKSAEAFVAAYLKGLATILKTDPRQYRSYGPFWWPLKALLVETGSSPGGCKELELGTLQHYTLDSPALTLCAAWAYQQEQIAQGKIHTASHQLELPEGELYEYELVDEEMENWIRSKAR